jgi:hypothetical protein
MEIVHFILVMSFCAVVAAVVITGLFRPDLVRLGGAGPGGDSGFSGDGGHCGDGGGGGGDAGGCH